MPESARDDEVEEGAAALDGLVEGGRFGGDVGDEGFGG